MSERKITKFTPDITEFTFSSTEAASSDTFDEFYDCINPLLNNTALKMQPSAANFSMDVINRAFERMEEEGVNISKISIGKDYAADGLRINIHKGGEQLGSLELFPVVNEDHKDDLLPDGNRLQNIEHYRWTNFELLEIVAKGQAEEADFVQGVASISSSEDTVNL